MPTTVTIPPSTEAWKWLPRTSLSTVFIQRSTARSSSRFCVSEGAGTNGTVLKDFRSSDEVLGGSAAATIDEPKSKKIDVVFINQINETNQKDGRNPCDLGSLRTPEAGEVHAPERWGIPVPIRGA